MELMCNSLGNFLSNSLAIKDVCQGSNQVVKGLRIQIFKGIKRNIREIRKS